MNNSIIVIVVISVLLIIGIIVVLVIRKKNEKFQSPSWASSRGRNAQPQSEQQQQQQQQDSLRSFADIMGGSYQPQLPQLDTSLGSFGDAMDWIPEELEEIEELRKQSAVLVRDARRFANQAQRKFNRILREAVGDNPALLAIAARRAADDANETNDEFVALAILADELISTINPTTSTAAFRAVFEQIRTNGEQIDIYVIEANDFAGEAELAALQQQPQQPPSPEEPEEPEEPEPEPEEPEPEPEEPEPEPEQPPHPNYTWILGESTNLSVNIDASGLRDFGRAVAYGVPPRAFGRFVAIGTDEFGKSAASVLIDAGETWDTRQITNSDFLEGITGVRWAVMTHGNEKFVAIGTRGNFPDRETVVAYSRRGYEWTITILEPNTRDLLITNAVWTSIKYGGGRFVAVGQTVVTQDVMTSRSVIMQSIDGISWHTVPSSAAISIDDQSLSIIGWYAMTHGGGKFVVLGVENSQDLSTIVATNNDGEHRWVTRRLPFLGSLWTSVAYGNGKFVAVADNGSNRIITSPDGVTWNIPDSLNPNIGNMVWKSVAYGNGKFVAVSRFSENTPYRRIMTSEDGERWVIVPRQFMVPPPDDDNNLGSINWDMVLYGNPRSRPTFVAIGSLEDTFYTMANIPL